VSERSEPEPMAAEFDAVATWTADAAAALGLDHYIPAACRGSGGPAALDWLLDRLDVTAGSLLLDVGAGVGGPAAHARVKRGLRCVLAEPEGGAVRAARRLFDLPAVRADAAALPLRTASVPVAWCLGVLCTTPDHRAVLRELRRVLEPGGRVGLLVYVATTELPEQPAGNNFPHRAGLAALIEDAGFAVLDTVPLTELPEEPDGWQRRVDAVRAVIAARHAGDDAWRLAEEQERTISHLIGSGAVAGGLYSLRVCRR
jgi:SAM-dependent methyltransferase